MSGVRIAIVGLGGTISSVGVSELDVLDYHEYGSKLPLEDILARVPSVPGVEQIVGSSVLRVGSSKLEPRDWVTLRDHLHQLVDDGADGIVILHGTATIEETAYFLNLTLSTDAPVVLVGAQRPFTTISSDALMNIVSAIRVVVDLAGGRPGVFVVANDEIHPARDVRKVANYHLNAFESPGIGPAGSVDGDQVTWFRSSAKRALATSKFRGLALERELPRVDVVYSYVGADGVPIDAVVAAGARGIIVAGLAPGLPSGGQWNSLQRARESGVVIVQSSRAVRDRVPRRKAHSESGFIAGDDLSPQKCRILLQLAFAANLNSSDDIAELFATH
jgi:L-asparaginase